MLNDIRWKFVAVVAILAMAVSLLSGGLSGIGFGTLMLRAIIGGFLFALLATGVNILISRFFPELLGFYDSDSEMGAVGTDDASDSDTGNRIDIVMPAESPSVGRMEGSPAGAGVDYSDGGRPEGSEGTDATSDESDGTMKGPIGDLDRFSSDFSDVEDDSPSKKPGGNGIMDDHDTEEIAQAIHTVMVRDEKG